MTVKMVYLEDALVKLFSVEIYCRFSIKNVVPYIFLFTLNAKPLVYDILDTDGLSYRVLAKLETSFA